jgi:hypothetical protein
MGRYKTHAKDGTPRAAEPQQDAQGHWFCPACGRAEGFKSKMAVLGHLRSCRPGKPALDDLLGDVGKAPAETGRSIYLPTPQEVTAVQLVHPAVMARLEAMEKAVRKVATNHIPHMGLAAANANAQSKGGGASGSGATWIAAGAVAVVALAAVNAARSDRVSAAAMHGFEKSEGLKRMEAMRDRSKAAKCAAIFQARAKGQDVEIDPACFSEEEGVEDAPVARRRRSSGAAITDALLSLGKAASTIKAVKQVFS